MRRWLGDLLAWPVDRPGAVIAAVLAVLAAVVAVLPGAWFDFSLEQLYPADSPDALRYAEHREHFGRDDDVVFAVRVGDPLHPELARVEEQLAAMPELLGVRSPLSFEVRELDAEGVLRGRPLRPGEHHRLASDLLVAADGSAGAVVARIADSHNQHQGRDALINRIQAVLDDADGQWHLAGVPVVRTAYVRLMMQDMATLLPLAMLISTAFFVASFRDLRHVLLAAGAVALGALAAASAYVATGAPFNVFAPAFVAVIIVVGTSDLVHLVHRFDDHWSRLGDSHAAARAAAREVGLACMLTSSSTALGFLVLLTTDIPPIRLFGLATGVGVLLTFAIAFLVVPAGLARLGPPARGAARHAARSADRLERVGRWVLQRRRAALALSAVATVGMLAGASRIHVDHKVLEDVRGSTVIAQAQDFVEDHLGAILPLQVELVFPHHSPWDPEALAATDALSRWLRAQEIVGHVIGPADLARVSWEAVSGEEALPPGREAAAQALLVASFSGEDAASAFVAEGAATGPDGQPRDLARITARLRDAGHHRTVALVDDLRAEAARLLDPLGAQANVTGPAWLAQEVNSTLTRQFAGSFGIALVVIGLAWLLATRSPRRTAVALLPNLLPLLALLAILGLSGLALKPSTAMVLSIGLGIAVDDTIHFLAAYETALRREKGAQQGKQRVHDAILHAYRTAGRSMTDTSVVLAAGFAVFFMSQFLASRNFGVLTACIVVVALLTDLFLLGPLLLTLEKGRRD